MLQNKFLLFLILFINYTFSQQKVDTIYVYEEVIVHDTIYIEKPINQIKLENIIFKKGANDEKGIFEVTQNGKIIQILVDSTNIVLPKIKPKKSLFFGAKFFLGLANNSLFQKFNENNSFGFGLGVWTQKKLFDSNFYLGVGIDGFYWNNAFSVDAATDNSTLNGYYFTDANQVFLFNSIGSKRFQVQIPIQIYYEFKKFKPSLGIFTSVSNYKSTFKSSSGKLPLSLDETQVFSAQALQIGYLVELQYEISKHISVGINFSSGKAKNLIFVNKGDFNQSFKTQNSFTENKFLLELVYRL